MGFRIPLAVPSRLHRKIFPDGFLIRRQQTPGGALVVASGDFHNSDIGIVVEKGRLDDLKPRVLALLGPVSPASLDVCSRQAR